MGIPHSVFLSWSEDDQDKALAFEEVKSEVCPQCATRESDWVDDEGYPLDDPRFQPVTHRCHGCAEIAKLKRTIPDDEEGIFVLFVTREEYEAKYKAHL